MKTKKLVSLILAAVMLMSIIPMSMFTAMAEDVLPKTGQCGDNVFWTFDSSTGALALSGKGKTFNYSPVFDDQRSPFYNNSSIKSVTVQDGITSLGDCIFDGCNNLDSASLPDTLEFIGYDSFMNTRISMNCTDDSFYIGNYLISSRPKTYNKLENFDVREGTVLIAEYAFRSCNIGTVTIPDSCKYINDYAFVNSKIGKVNISKGVEKIGECIFYGSLVSEIIVSPENKFYCSENGVLFNKDKTELIAFPNDSKITSYTVPATVKKIDRGAFDYNINLNKIVFSEGLEVIDSCAFTYTTRLEAAILPDTLKELGELAFGLSGIKELKIPAGTEKYGSNIGACLNLRRIELNSNISSDLRCNSPCLSEIVVNSDVGFVESFLFTHYSSEEFNDIAYDFCIYSYEIDILTTGARSTDEITKIKLEYINSNRDKFKELLTKINPTLAEDFPEDPYEIMKILTAVREEIESSIVSGPSDKLVVFCKENSEQHANSVFWGIKHSIIGSDFDCTCGIHDAVESEYVAPTCGQNGYVGGKVCRICEAVVEAPDIVPPTGEHDIVENEYIAPTCVQNGYIGGKVCRVCETVFEAPEIVPPTGEHTDRNKDNYCDVCQQWLGEDEEPDFIERFTMMVKSFFDAIVALFRRLFR
ncbi:MAG: leucine-rich repeat domain-containing protein [Clostridia bacterium]|nr:leucine-rich repeat domain-containing protein [Clostridia bacterium]